MTRRYQFRLQNDIDSEEVEGAIAAIAPQGESLTEQHHKDSADLNQVVKRYGVRDGAALPAGASVTDPRYYGDFSDAVDFRTALDRTREAVERFNALPGDIRQEFNNDPVSLYHWVNDPKNHEEAVKLGLLKKHKGDPPATPANPPIPPTV